MKRKILKSFALIILVLIAMGLLNAGFFFHNRNTIEEMAARRFSVEQQVQAGQELIAGIHSDIWDAMLFDIHSREKRIRQLDRQALAFGRVIDALEGLVPEDAANIRQLKREFQTYYLTGKQILKLADLAAFQKSGEEAAAFRRSKNQLGSLIRRTFDAYQHNFAQALKRVRSATLWFLLLSVSAVLLGAVAACWLSFRLTDKLVRPVRGLTETVRRIKNGDRCLLADESFDDEIGDLARTFNAMTLRLNRTVADLEKQITERIQAEQAARDRQAQLVRADKMASLGVLVAGVAHEINNPNQFIMSTLPSLRKAWEGALPVLDSYQRQFGDFKVGGANYTLTRAQVPHMFDNIESGSRRIKAIVDELRQFGRDDPEDAFGPVQLNEIVRSALTLTNSLVKKATDRFVWYPNENLPLCTGHFQRLEQVVVNLIQNACQAVTDPNKAICLATRYNTHSNEVELAVNDEGEGISPEAIDRILDPFYTTKREKGGTGLGLSISSHIIAQHGGRLIFESSPDRGTTVRVCLPKNDTRQKG